MFGVGTLLRAAGWEACWEGRQLCRAPCSFRQACVVLVSGLEPGLSVPHLQMRSLQVCVGVGSGLHPSTATSSRAPLWPRFSLSLKWGRDDLPPLVG